MPRSAADLRARAKKALAHPRFKDFHAAVPVADHADPAKVLSWWLAAAQLDPKGAASEQGRAVHEALRELVGAQQIEDNASRLYHQAIERGVVSREEADRLWADPEAARAKLAEIRAADPDLYWGDLGQLAASVIYEAPAADAETSADPEPSDEGERSGEQDRYLEIKGEADPLPEADHYSPRDDDSERPGTPGPQLF